jgi:hypothetical protein
MAYRFDALVFKVAAESNPTFLQDHVAHDNPADKYYCKEIICDILLLQKPQLQA